MVVHELVKDLLYESFSKNQKITVIDYGCGNGLLLNFLDMNTIHRYVGYDINANSIKLAKDTYGKKKNISFELIKKGKVPNLGRRNCVDAVILVGVLQYISDTELNILVKEVSRVKKKNGVLIFTCATDHVIYKLLNIYKFFIPNRFINRKKLINTLKKAGFKVVFQKEKGFIITPLFSNCIVLFFDILDKIIFKTKGELGPIGTKIRLLADQIIKLEYRLPIDYGYTLVVKAKNLN